MCPEGPSLLLQFTIAISIYNSRKMIATSAFFYCCYEDGQFMTLLCFIFRYLDLLVQVEHYIYYNCYLESSACLWGLKTLCCCWLNQSLRAKLSSSFVCFYCVHIMPSSQQKGSLITKNYQPHRVNVRNADSVCCMIFEARPKLLWICSNTNAQDFGENHV